MEAEQLQGLVYLLSGAAIVGFLTLSFRFFGRRFSHYPGDLVFARNSWLEKEELELVEIKAETHDIKSFRFVRSNGKGFPKFRPGQFLTFQIGMQQKLTRSYSISSSNLEEDSVRVSIKQIARGQGSSWFHQCKLGERIWAYPAIGHFTDSHLQKQPRVFIAGGIGITPFLSMILSNLGSSHDCEMYLFYGMRTEADMAFHEQLLELSHKYSSFKYFPILSNAKGEWGGDRGFINLEWVKEKVKLTNDMHYFLCGPSVLMDSFVAVLLKSGVGEDHIYTEAFVSAANIDPAAIPIRSVKILFQGQQYEYHGRQTILDFLEAQGAEIPHACRVGVCGTCRCRMTGKVLTLTDAGLSLMEKQQGYKLSCVAFPSEDMSVELG